MVYNYYIPCTNGLKACAITKMWTKSICFAASMYAHSFFCPFQIMSYMFDLHNATIKVGMKMYILVQEAHLHTLVMSSKIANTYTRYSH